VKSSDWHCTIVCLRACCTDNALRGDDIGDLKCKYPCVSFKVKAANIYSVSYRFTVYAKGLSKVRENCSKWPRWFTLLSRLHFKIYGRFRTNLEKSILELTIIKLGSLKVFLKHLRVRAFCSLPPHWERRQSSRILFLANRKQRISRKGRILNK